MPPFQNLAGGRNPINAGFPAMVSGRLMKKQGALVQKLAHNVLNSALAQTSETAEVCIASAVYADATGPGLSSFIHEAVDGVLPGGEAIGDAIQGTGFRVA